MKVQAKDLDSGNNGVVSYTLISCEGTPTDDVFPSASTTPASKGLCTLGNSTSPFQIQRDNGEIRVSAVLDRESIKELVNFNNYS